MDPEAISNGRAVGGFESRQARGSVVLQRGILPPWCLSSARSAALAPYLAPTGGHLILYHFLTEGRAYATLPDGRREELSAGDIVVLPHGDAHMLGNGRAAKP